jgi:hypothetical protein
MPDDSARHRIGGNFPPEHIDDSAQYHSNPPPPVSARRRDGPPEPPLADIQSPLLSIPAAQKYLGDMGKTKIYELMARGELEVCKLVGRSFVTRRSSDAYIERNCGREIDAKGRENVKKAVAESLRVRRERAEARARQHRAEAKKRRVPGKARGRSERRVAAAPID